jgi:hypothetical protein
MWVFHQQGQRQTDYSLANQDLIEGRSTPPAPHPPQTRPPRTGVLGREGTDQRG